MNRKTLYEPLIVQAEHLATLDPRRPTQASLRRALSTVYYSLFHFLVDQGTKQLVGTGASTRSLRAVLGRAYEHGTMASACRSFDGGTLPSNIAEKLPTGFQFPIEVRMIANAFVNAQDDRHSADYDLSITLFRHDVISRIEDVRTAINA